VNNITGTLQVRDMDRIIL